MRLRRRPGHELDHPQDGAERAVCTDHVWRIRDVTYALPGSYISEVCQRCGALQVDGPGDVTTLFDDQVGPRGARRAAAFTRGEDVSELEALAARWSERDVRPPPPPPQ